MQGSTVRIGSRGSPLALTQAYELRDRLMAAHGTPATAYEISTIATSGDRIQDRPLSEVGGKGLFTKEIEVALLAGEIDLAVHSMKDMPTQLPDGLMIACILPREDVRDAFISPNAASLAGLPDGATVGTSSLRRQAQVRLLRPDLRVVGFRGNVETRLRKLKEGEADATLLAYAGLKRLGMQDDVTAVIEDTDMLPAVAQGAIGVEVCVGNSKAAALLAPINDETAALEVATERAFLARLDGSCRTPIAGLARLQTQGADAGRLHFRGQILAVDGSQSFATERSGLAQEAAVMGHEAAEELLARAGPDFLAV